MREQLEKNAQQNGRSLHAEILLRLGHSLEAASGEPKFGFSESFSGLSDDFGLSEAQEARVREIAQEIVQQALKPK